MFKTLVELLRTPALTQSALFPDLPAYARGLPGLSDAPCDDCGACVAVCPTRVVTVQEGHVTLDRGACIACGGCVAVCGSGTIVADRSTRVASRTRKGLVLDSTAAALKQPESGKSPFRRSLHVREVSTGDNASDLETAALNNPIFDASRFGVHFVASPRHADALLVTGPVGLAMQEPLRRCFEAMPEPRLVIAAGAGAISGGLHAGGYAAANGVDAVLPVDVYVPGHPPHPWYLLHGVSLAMGGSS